MQRNTTEIQRKYKGNTKENEGNTKGNKGNMKEL